MGDDNSLLSQTLLQYAINVGGSAASAFSAIDTDNTRSITNEKLAAHLLLIVDAAASSCWFRLQKQSPTELLSHDLLQEYLTTGYKHSAPKRRATVSGTAWLSDEDLLFLMLYGDSSSHFLEEHEPILEDAIRGYLEGVVETVSADIWVHLDQTNEGTATPKPPKSEEEQHALQQKFDRLTGRAYTAPESQADGTNPLESTVAELRTALQESQSNLAAAEEEAIMAETEVETLKEQLSQAQKRAEQLESQVSDQNVVEIRGDILMKAGVARWKNAYLNGIVNRLNTEVGILVEELGQRDMQIASLTDKLQEALEQLQNSQTSLSSLEEMQQLTEEELSRTKEASAMSSDELQQSLVAAIAEREELKTVLSAKEDELTATSDVLSAKEALLVEHAEKEAELSETVTQLSTQIEHVEQDSLEKQEALQEALRQETEHKQALQEDLSNTGQLLNQSQTELEASQSQLAETEIMVAEKDGQLSHEKEIEAQQQAEIMEDLQRITQLEKQIKKKDKVLAEEREELVFSKQKISELQLKLATIAAENEKLENSLDQKHDLCVDLEKQVAKQQLTIMDRQADVDAVKLQLAVDRNTIVALKEKADNKDTLDDMKHQLYSIGQQLAEDRDERGEILASTQDRAEWLDEVSLQVARVLQQTEEGDERLAKIVARIVSSVMQDEVGINPNFAIPLQM
eukprot:gene13882-16409_t